MRWIAIRACMVAWVIAASACDTGEAQTSATEVMPPPGTGDMTGGVSASGTGTDGTGTGAPDPTDGGELDCDLWTQNCPEGQKCNLYDNDGPQELDGAKCVPVVEPPQQLGELCQWQDGFGSGLDDCDVGLFCWPEGPNGQGTCKPLCTGSADDPQCPEGMQCGDGVGYFLYVCLPECDPLAQDCLEGTMCVQTLDGFVCALDKSGDGGALYDPCVNANGCDPGHMCAKPGAAPGCLSQGPAGCCVPFCEVGGSSCPPELECVGLFDPDAYPDYAPFGVCADPEP